MRNNKTASAAFDRLEIIAHLDVENSEKGPAQLRAHPIAAIIQ
jgi:hypothetical protein